MLGGVRLEGARRSSSMGAQSRHLSNHPEQLAGACDHTSSNL
jgi:hypothetical protein